MAQRLARLTRCGEVLRAADRSVIDHGDQTFEGAKLSFFRPNQSVEIGYSATAGGWRRYRSHSPNGRELPGVASGRAFEILSNSRLRSANPMQSSFAVLHRGWCCASVSGGHA